jgi:hypothetical protein
MAYLVVLIQILADLFRDHGLSGWWKAVWVFFLLFVPVMTALIYLITRGHGMAQRGIAEAKATQNDTDAYIRSVSAGTKSPSAEIQAAKELLDSGTISHQEYEALKAKALG